MRDRNKIVSPTAGVIFLIILTLIVFITISFVLNRAGLFRLPAFIENLFERETETEPPENEYGSLFDALRDEISDNQNFVPANIDSDMLTKLFISASLPQKYYHALTIGYSYDGKKFTSYNSVIIRDDSNYSVQISRDGEVIKTVRAGPSAIRTSGSSNGLTRTFSGTGTFSVADEAGIPDLTYIASIISDYVASYSASSDNTGENTNDTAETDADNSSDNSSVSQQISDYTVYTSISPEGNFMYISFFYEDLQITELYKISLDYNVIWEAESKTADGIILYRAVTDEFTTDITNRNIK